MPPSDSENCRFGKRCSTPENSRSTVVHIRLVANSAIATMNGGFDVSCGCLLPNEKPGTKPPEPKCSDSGVPASSHTANSGSQCRVWKEGRPRLVGASGKVKVRAT